MYTYVISGYKNGTGELLEIYRFELTHSQKLAILSKPKQKKEGCVLVLKKIPSSD